MTLVLVDDGKYKDQIAARMRKPKDRFLAGLLRLRHGIRRTGNGGTQG